MPEFTDLQLIKKVKNQNDSDALNELVNRHSGIYMEMIGRYSYVPELEKQELIENKSYNIYKYALDYKEDKNTKFSSYIGNRVKYECKTLISHKIEKEEITDNVLIDYNSPNDAKNEFYKYILSKINEIEDKRFVKIIEMKFFKDKKATLPEIGLQLGITNERVRQIYEKNIRILRRRFDIIKKTQHEY